MTPSASPRSVPVRPGRLPALTSPGARAGAIVFAVAVLAVPLVVADRFWITIVATAGVYALGAIGLNVLSGYLGEPSMGQAFFLAVGCYAGLAAGKLLQLPLILWLIAVLVIGGLVGLLVAPLASRLSGEHLIIVTLGLVYVGTWIFNNWRSLSGGPNGTPVALPLEIGAFDFGDIQLGALRLSSGQGLALLIWICVCLALLWVSLVSRSRLGREMRAIRDNVLAAQVAGVRLWRNRRVAFVMCGALAGLAGALYAQSVRFVEPAVFGITMSVELVAMLIIGGSATTYGPVIGALFVAFVPAVLDRYLGDFPFILGPTESGFGMTVPQLSGTIFALLLVFFIVREPRGVATLIRLGTRTLNRRLRRPATAPTEGDHS